MDYWNDILTEKSWNILRDLRKKNLKFIVIGGWSAYLWTKLHKSKDIDIIIPNYKDLEVIKQEYDLKKNDNLKKYEIKIEEIDIDIYIPFYSRLSIPLEKIKDYTTTIENFTTVIPEVLIILKQGAELNRKDTIKGIKDQVDILTVLFKVDIDFKEYYSLIKTYNLKGYDTRLKQIIQNFKEHSYLNLNPREFKIKKNEVFKKLKC